MALLTRLNRKWAAASVALAVVTMTLSQQALGEDLLKRTDITPELASVLADFATESMAATFEKRPPEIQIPADSPAYAARNGVHIVLVENGEIHGEATARQTTLIGNIRVAAARVAAGKTREQVAGATMLLTILFAPERLPIAPVPNILRRYSEEGIDGFLGDYKGLESFLPPVMPILKDYNSREILTELVQKVSPPPEGQDPAGREEATRVLKLLQHEGFRVSLMPGQTIAVPPEGRPELLTGAVRMLPLTGVTRDAVTRSLALADQWYRRHQAESGAFPYQYNPVTDETVADGLFVRTAMNVWALGTLWRHTNDDQVRKRGLKALEHLFATNYQEDEAKTLGYFMDGKRAPLGGAAAGLLAIVSLKAWEDNPDMRQKAEKLVAFIKTLRHADGHYDTQYPPLAEPRNVDYYPGEAQLALMEWAGAVNDRELVGLCLESMHYYRDYFGKTGNLPFIPWHTQACVRLYASVKRPEIAEFVFTMNDLLITAQQIHPADGERLPAYARGRFWNPARRRTGAPHVSSTGVYMEGLADAFVLARQLGDRVRTEHYRRALLWGTRNLLQLQIRDEIDLLPMASAEKAMGGFRTRQDNPRIRIDNMQHAVSALVKVHAIMTDADYAMAAQLAQE